MAKNKQSGDFKDKIQKSKIWNTTIEDLSFDRTKKESAALVKVKKNIKRAVALPHHTAEEQSPTTKRTGGADLDFWSNAIVAKNHYRPTWFRNGMFLPPNCVAFSVYKSNASHKILWCFIAFEIGKCLVFCNYKMRHFGVIFQLFCYCIYHQRSSICI